MRTQSTALLLVLSAGFGCSEHKVGRFNSLPEATITSHADGATAYEGETLTLTGRVSDPDHAMEDLLASWRIGEELVCEEFAPSDAGGTSCEVVITLESEEVILEVRDPESGAATDSIELDVQANQAPTAEILNPTADTPWYADELIDFEAQVGDTEDQPEDLVIEWSSDVDGDLKTGAEESDGTGSATGIGSLSEGEHRITLTVTDTMGKSVSETELIEVGPPNTAPECSISSPFDGTISELGEELELSGVAWDSDTEDLTTLAGTWRSSIDGLLASTNPDEAGVIELTLDTLSRGTHEITLSVTDEADEACSDTVELIIGSPPEVEITSPLEGELTDEGVSLTLAGTVTDGDQDPDTLSLAWSSDVDGVLSTDPADSDGSTGLDVDSLTVGTHILSLSVSDDHDMSTEVSVSLVVNGAPGAPEISISPDPASTIDELVVSIDVESADPEDDTISYTYAWTRDGSATSDTASTISSSDTTRDESWEVTVTPDDGRLSGPAATASVTIDNTAPEITDLALSPLAVYTDDSITATASSDDADGDTVSLSYLWEVDGIPVAETSDTLDGATWFDRDQVVQVTVTPNDGSVDGDAWSESITVLNTAPEATSVSISPTELFTDDDARAVVSGSDADGDSLSYTYDWYVDGALVTETSSTLSGTDYFDKDQLVYVVANPDDGTDTGSSATSSTITVSNTPPEITALSLSPDPVGTDDALVATATTTDADGDSVTTYWKWEVSGVVSSETSDTLDGTTEFELSDTIQVTATPDDGDDLGDPYTSSTVTVGNSPPELSSGSLSPSVVYTNDTITASVNTTDADGEAVSIAYSWYVDGSLVASTSATLDGISWFDKDQEVSLDVVLTDASGESAIYAVGKVTISNTPPEDPEIAIDPEEPRDGTDDLVCEIEIDAEDDDLDSISYSFSWQVDGSTWTGSTDTTVYSGDTIPGSETDAGEIWTCTATSDDGEDTGGSDSDSVTIIQGFGGWESSTMSAADADYEASGEDDSDLAGSAVTGLGDVDGDGYDDILIGGYGADATGTSTGMGFILLGDGLSTSRDLDLSNADYRLIGEELNDYAGKVVAPAGDVDNDGLPDVLITAYGDDTNGSNAGKAYLILSRELSTAAELYLYDADHIFLGETAGDQAGSSAYTAGDVDGDGCDDLIIGAYGNDDSASNAGAAYLWLCSSIVDEEIQLGDADLILYGDSASDNFGRSVSGGTDTDGDGYDDLLIGADGVDDGGTSAGAAYLFRGASSSAGTALASDASIIFIGEDTSDAAGYTVAMPGDVDGDDSGDVLIGSYGDDSGGSSAGKTYLFFADSLASSGSYDLYESDHAFVGESAGDTSSIGLSGAGDVDRDGQADILIGAPMNDKDGTNSGTAYLILSDSLSSSRNIDLSSADFAFTGEDVNDQHGRAVSGAGDVDGDELDDFLIGAPYNDAGGTNAGAVYLWLSD